MKTVDKSKESPLCQRTRNLIRRNRSIGFEVLRNAARTEAEWRALRGAIRHLKGDHPARWQEQLLTGSLLKRLRNMQGAV